MGEPIYDYSDMPGNPDDEPANLEPLLNALIKFKRWHDSGGVTREAELQAEVDRLKDELDDAKLMRAEQEKVAVESRWIARRLAKRMSEHQRKLVYQTWPWLEED